LYVGGDEVTQAYLGSTLVWEPEVTPPPSGETAFDNLVATILAQGPETFVRLDGHTDIADLSGNGHTYTAHADLFTTTSDVTLMEGHSGAAAMPGAGNPLYAAMNSQWYDGSDDTSFTPNWTFFSMFYVRGGVQSDTHVGGMMAPSGTTAIFRMRMDLGPTWHPNAYGYLSGNSTNNLNPGNETLPLPVGNTSPILYHVTFELTDEANNLGTWRQYVNGTLVREQLNVLNVRGDRNTPMRHAVGFNNGGTMGTNAALGPQALWMRTLSEAEVRAQALAGGVAGYVATALNLGADVLIDGDTDIVANQVINGTSITLGTGPDGLTSLVDGTGISIPMPALPTPVVGISVAVLVKVISDGWAQVIDGQPITVGPDRGIEAAGVGGAADHDYRFDQRQNLAAVALNRGAGSTGWAFLVGRLNVALGVELTVCHNQTTRQDVEDPAPLPTVYDWSVANTQSMPDIAPGVLEVAGVAIWHDYLLTDADIDTLYATLPSV
jgi:hypothetical protein